MPDTNGAMPQPGKIGNSSGNNAGTENAGMGPGNNAEAPDAGIKGNNQRAPGPGGMESAFVGGSDLVYTDDDPDSYYNIFDNVIGKNSKKSDYKRVIKAIKKLSEGKDLEKYFDVDQILKYLAAHTVVVNLDSYSSNMCQNYVLYEKKGRVTILPWDYGLAFGGMNLSNASEVVNFPIDSPVSGAALSDRPLIEKLFENKEYLERYHKYLQEIMEDYFCKGKFDAKINKIDSLIRENVKNDVSKFISYEEYTKAVEAFKALGNLRAQSIKGQLDGTVPDTTDGQKNNPDKLISAGDINLSDLGTMG
jgi:spore coat protein CotH